MIFDATTRRCLSPPYQPDSSTSHEPSQLFPGARGRIRYNPTGASGGGSGMGRELVRQLVVEACNVATCDVSVPGMTETQRLCEAAGLPQGLRHHSPCRRVRRRASAAISRRGRRAPRHGQDSSVVQQRRHQWRRQHDRPLPRRVGTDIQHLLGWRISLHPRLPADAAERRRGPHRQHQQRERLLGVDRTVCPPTSRRARGNHGERLHRGVHQHLLIAAPTSGAQSSMQGLVGTSIPFNSRKIGRATARRRSQSRATFVMARLCGDRG